MKSTDRISTVSPCYPTSTHAAQSSASIRSGGAIAALAFSALLVACEAESERDVADVLASEKAAALPTVEATKAFNPRLLRRFLPARSEIVSDRYPLSLAKIQLGRMLFHDERLSGSQAVSCSSCHELKRYGTDGMKTSRGHLGQLGNRNAPTVFHAAGHFEQFWDGREPDVEHQALGPILNPAEMAAPSEAHVVSVLQSIPGYVAAFKEAFPENAEPITFQNVGVAIGAFERKLTTRARWDDYLEGNPRALMSEELEGLRLFTNLGCMVCHTGEMVGGSMYERAGVVEPWPDQADQGRFGVTHREGDRMMFKVPTLRNVSETGPYFHDGSGASLGDAVRMMGRHQLGLELEDTEVKSIVAWLGSLRGQLPNDLIARPDLPPNGPRLPRPDSI